MAHKKKSKGSRTFRELEELRELIYKSKPTLRADYVVGFYRYMAKIDAIENVLVKNKIITHEQIANEMIPILQAMKKDFKNR